MTQDAQYKIVTPGTASGFRRLTCKTCECVFDVQWSLLPKQTSEDHNSMYTAVVCPHCDAKMRLWIRTI